MYMSSTIISGTGNGGYGAKVGTDNRLWVNSISEPEATQANIDGNAYNLNTGKITLTNATDTPVMYFKNNETSDYIIEAIAVGFGTSDGTATEPVEITVVRNPTAGTIISSPTNVDINSNRNFGSFQTLSNSLVYKGATGDTMTDGTDHLFFLQPDFGRLFATISEVLPKGSAIGVKIKPPTSNTGLDCYVALIGHLFTET
jgi:hypothetical protein